MSYTVNIKTRVDIDENKNYVFNKYVVATVDFSLDISDPTYNNDELESSIKDAIAMWDQNQVLVEGALIETTFTN